MQYESDRPPRPGDLCTFCHPALHKRAALLFDRIYVVPGDHQGIDIPPEWTFGVERLDRQLAARFNDDLRDLQSRAEFDLILAQVQGRDKESVVRDYEATLWNTAFPAVACGIVSTYSQMGVTVVPGYLDHRQFVADFADTGTGVVYEAALRQLPLLNADATEWDQIKAFRSDQEAVTKLRNLRMWLRDGLKTNDIEHAADTVSRRLDDYSWALKKHGLETIRGSLTFILDFKQAGITASAAAAGAAIGGPVVSALAAGLVVAGQVAAWAIGRSIEWQDVRRGENSEVAYIFDANERFRTS